MKSLDDYFNKRKEQRNELEEMIVTPSRLEKLSSLLIGFAFLAFFVSSMFLSAAKSSTQATYAMLAMALSIVVGVIPLFIERYESGRKKSLVHNALSRQSRGLTEAINQQIKEELAADKKYNNSMIEGYKSDIEIAEKELVAPVSRSFAAREDFRLEIEDINSSSYLTEVEKEVHIARLNEIEELTFRNHSNAPKAVIWARLTALLVVLLLAIFFIK
jgi:hypothetical protein